MSLNRAIALVLLWLLTVVASFLAAQHLTRVDEHSTQTPIASASTPREQTSSNDVVTARLNALEQENSELKDKLVRIEGEREKLGKEYLELALKQALQGVGSSPSSRDDVQTLWQQGFDEFQRHDKQGLGAGLGLGIGLLFDMAQFGEKGIFFLRDIVTDTQRSVRERELALNVLSLMHTKKALRVIMDLQAPDITELDYPYDLILPQLATLTYDELAEYIPEINSHVAHDLQIDDPGLAPEKVDVLAYLAFSHNNQDSLRLLYDPKAFQEDLSTTLRLAQENHSPQARQYVEAVAAQGVEGNRPLANRILQAW